MFVRLKSICYVNFFILPLYWNAILCITALETFSNQYTCVYNSHDTFSSVAIPSHSNDDVVCSRKEAEKALIDSTHFEYNKEVFDALRIGKPIVALESTVISHGLPYPLNFEIAKELEAIVRSHYAVPATIAIIRGKIHIGLTENELMELAQNGDESKVVKVSKRDIVEVLAGGQQIGATTVAATSWIAHRAGIKVFVTGGIGGVHRYGESTMDISSDLHELGRVPIAVVCSGVKSILDIGKTLEVLETYGVAVIGYNTTEFPSFFTKHSGFQVNRRLNTSQQCAHLIAIHENLQMDSGILIAVPIPDDEEANGNVIESAIQKALEEANEKGITGNEITPFLLKRINELTGGESLRSNIALLKNNARVGAEISFALSSLYNRSSTSRAEEHSSSSSSHRNFLSILNRTFYPVVIVGGASVDLIGQSKSTLVHGESNPGKVSQYWGGVGRNIAEVLSRLGTNPLLISAVGNDFYGENLLKHMKTIGMSTDGILIRDQQHTATYSAILNNDGQLNAAISDMEIFSEITIDNSTYWHSESICGPSEQASKIIVMDANLPTETISSLATLAKRCQKEQAVWFEPTSVAKIVKIANVSILKNIDFISPNVAELIALANALGVLDPSSDSIMPDHCEGYKHYIRALLTMGIRYVLLKMSAEGVLLGAASVLNVEEPSDINNNNEMIMNNFYFKKYDAPLVDKIVSVTGAGDSLVGAFIWCLIEQRTPNEMSSIMTTKQLDECMQFGLLAAKLTLESEFSVSPRISRELFLERMKRY